MVTKTFTYTGFDGKTYTDEWCFHLYESDMFKINYGSLTGLDEMIKKLIDTKNGKEIMNLIDEIIMASVGKRAADGRMFIKNDELRNEFRQTEAYSQLFMELVMNGDKAAEFLMGTVPAEIAAKAKKAEENQQPKLEVIE